MRLNEYGFNRRYERKIYGAHVSFAHQNKVYNGILRNISLGGVFIITPIVNGFAQGDTITVSIPFASNDKHVKRKGRITRLSDEGFAVEFL